MIRPAGCGTSLARDSALMLLPLPLSPIKAIASFPQELGATETTPLTIQFTPTDDSAPSTAVVELYTNVGPTQDGVIEIYLTGDTSGLSLSMYIIFVFGVFIFVHGHLTPGGGFQGGVVIASGVLLALLAGTLTELSHGMLSVLEMLSGAGYVGVVFAMHTAMKRSFMMTVRRLAGRA